MARTPTAAPGRPRRAGPARAGRGSAWWGARAELARLAGVADRRRGPAEPGRRPRRVPASARAVWWPRLAALARQSGAVVAASQCFGTRAGWRSRRWRTGCAARPSSPRPGRSTRSGATRSTAWCPAEDAPGGRGVAATRAMVDAWQRHRFFEGLARALLGVGRPTLLVLDNLQWCDQETLAFLTFFLGLVARRAAAGGRRRCATTTRTTSPRVGGLGRPDAGHRLLTELALGPLDARRHRHARRGDLRHGRSRTPTRDLLHAATGGFPLYVVEAMRSRRRPGRGAAGRRPRGRAAQPAGAGERRPPGRWPAWPPRSGRDFTLDLLTEASDLDADAVVARGRRAVAAPDHPRARRRLRLLPRPAARRRPTTLVSPPRRWLLHRRLAQGARAAARRATPDAVVGAARRAVRPRRPARAGRRGTTAAPPRSRPACSPTPRRSGCTPRRWRSCEPGPAGRDRDGQELAVLEAMAAPLNARYGYSSPRLQQVLERAVELAESLGRRDSLVSGLVGLWSSQFVQGRVADADRTATRALGLVEPGAELGGAAHFACGGSAVSLGRPAEALRALRARRASGRRRRLAQRRHPDRRARAGLVGARALAARPRRPGPVQLPTTRSRWPGRSATRTASRWRWPTPPSPTSCAATGPRCAARSPSWPSSATGSASPTTASGRWSSTAGAAAASPGSTLARRGIDNLRSEGSFARMPYWLSLLADVLDRAGQRDAARSTSTPPPRARRRAATCGGSPRCCGCAPPTTSSRPAAVSGSARRPTWRPGTAASRCCAAANATSPSAAFARRSPPFAPRPDVERPPRTLGERPRS